MLEYDFDRSVGFWVIRTARALERALDEELRPHGITRRQYQVLGWLAADGPLCQRDLAERIGIEPPTLAGVLERMQRDGWVERTTCPDDRRKKMVAATARAVPAWEEIAKCARRVRARAAADLEETQLEALRGLLASVERGVRTEEVPR